MRGRHPYLEHPGPIAFAHRGGAAVQPENTWASFAHAVELGYRYIETDARVTSDGVVLAFHDATLDRMCGRAGVISTLRWDEVRTARIAGEHEPVRMDELLDTYPDVHFNIDAKDDAVVEPLARVIERTGAVHRVCVASFSDARQARIRSILGPDLCVAGGPRAVARIRLSPGARWPRPLLASCVQVPLRTRGVRIVDERFLRTAHRVGVVVHVWTIDDATEMHRLLDLGVDGIMTDRPSVLRDVLTERGEWFGRS